MKIYSQKLDGIGMKDLDEILAIVYDYSDDQYKKGKKGYVGITKDNENIMVESFTDKIENVTSNEFLYSVKFSKSPFIDDDDNSEWDEELSILRLQLEPIKVLNWDGEEYE